jgi:hypothetical protein
MRHLFRPLITILVSDFEDSSSLCEKLGDLRAHEVVRVHNEIFRQQVADMKSLLAPDPFLEVRAGRQPQDRQSNGLEIAASLLARPTR